MVKTVWAVEEEKRRRSATVRYHLYKGFLDPSYERYYRPICMLENDDQVQREEGLWVWSSPPKEKQCKNCRRTAMSILMEAYDGL